jgi:hypothetical protein
MTQTARRPRARVAPYVPASTLSAFFDHIRYVKTPDKVDTNLLQDYGVAKGHAFALLSALKFLGLTEDDGTLTPAFRLLQSGGEEFQTNLREIVERAYDDLFSRLDVSRDGRDKILNFFARNYSPATAEKATRLFLDLCGEAGIPTAAKEPRKVARRRGKKMLAKKSEEILQGQEAEEEKPSSTVMEDKGWNQSGVSIHIDSKDLASMNPQQIQALFDGLGKIMRQGREASNNEGTR